MRTLCQSLVMLGGLLAAAEIQAQALPDPLVYYAMDESSWAASDSVIDSSGNGYHGNALTGVTPTDTSPAISGSPGTCGYGVIPSNDAELTIEGINTGVDIDNDIGHVGTISFWYRSNVDWVDGDHRQLFDATTQTSSNNGNFFYLTLRNSGKLNFVVKGGGGRTIKVQTSAQSIAANTWTHIGASWDLPGDKLSIYINGSLAAELDIPASNGMLNNTTELVLGDNNGTFVTSPSTGNSANGLIDEARIYNVAASTALMQQDMLATHPCTTGADHLAISHDATAINCLAESITINAHLADHTLDTSYTGTLSLATSTNHGDWTIVSANGTLDNGSANDGAATYSMVSADMGSVVLGLKNPHAETVNINVSDGTISELSGSALASEDADLVFAAAGFVFLADSTANAIGTQIGNKSNTLAPGAQVLEVQAVRTSDSTGQCEAALVGSTNLELAVECRNPSSCSSRQVRVNDSTDIAGNSLASVTSYTSVALDFGDASDGTASFSIAYPDAGQLMLYARYNIPLDDGSSTPSGQFMLGSSNAFVVRPLGFAITATGNPAATSSSGSVFTTAGNGFTVTASAVLWEAADDSNNDGIADGHNDTLPNNNADLSNNLVALNYGQETSAEALALSALLDQPSGGNDPGLTGTTTISSFSNGVGTATVSYAEVGIIEIRAQVSDADYLGIGSDTAAIVGRSGYVGRFIPSHFALSAGNLVNRSNAMCTPAATFTYMDELLQLEFTLTAENSLNATTQNYTGAFAKLDPTMIADLYIGAIDNTAPTPLSSRISTATSSGAWSSGVAAIFARAALARNTSLDGPFTTLAWGVAPQDSDGVVLNGLDLDVDDNGSDDHGLVATNAVRFGRAIVENAAGSELLPLTLPIRVEYYDGIQFRANTDDGCSSYAATSVSFSNLQGLTADPTAMGSGQLIQGGFDPANPVTLNSNAQIGNVEATLTVPDYLQFDWDEDSLFDDNPSAKMTFGIFNREERRIYYREVY